MKVLQITHKFPPGFSGGSGNSAYILSKELQSMGNDVKVIAFDLENFKENNSSETFDDLSIYRFHVKNKGRLTNLIDLALVNKIKSLIKEFNPDVIHIHSIWTVGLTPLVALNNFKGKVIIKLPDYVYICPRGNMLNKNKNVCTNPRLSNCYKCVKFGKFIFHLIPRYYTNKIASKVQFLAPSRHMKAMFNKANRKLKVDYFPNFHAPEFDKAIKLSRNELKTKYNIQSNKVILFSGRILKIKGYTYLLEAASQLRTKDFTLLIAGNNIDGEYFFNQIKKYKLIQKVKFLNHIPLDFLPEIYKLSDMLVVPSIWPDNSPNVIYEAMASGIPIIGSDVGGIPDLVINGENGYLVPPGNAKKIAEKIDFLFENPTDLLKMKEASSLRSRKYKSNKLVKQLFENYYS